MLSAALGFTAIITIGCTIVMLNDRIAAMRANRRMTRTLARLTRDAKETK